jgi:circadian clock protein KaiC
MKKQLSIEKLKTGLPGFEVIANGGLPKGRTTLIAGTAGSAKTVFAAQFLAEGITQAGENGVFITFEEAPTDIRMNMRGFGWDIQRWEAAGKWAFVDASPQPGEETLVTGPYDLGALLARTEFAVQRVGARRVSMDSLGAIFTRFADSATVCSELFRIASALREKDVTAIITAERTEEYADIACSGGEELVADNVIILRNVLEEEERCRTMEILRFRGTVIPLSVLELKQKSSDLRISSGHSESDKWCGGGFFREVPAGRL